MKHDALREGNEKRSIVHYSKTLSQVITQLFPFLIFPVIDFSGDYLRKYMRELNES